MSVLKQLLILEINIIMFQKIILKFIKESIDICIDITCKINLNNNYLIYDIVIKKTQYLK